jgi:hypothetical protein
MPVGSSLLQCWTVGNAHGEYFVGFQQMKTKLTATTGNMNDNDAETKENWKKLCTAIHKQDVPTVATLLTLHPELAHHRNKEDVSPSSDTHGYRQI